MTDHPTTMLSTVHIPAAFCGPPGMGNGGWVCGTLAGFGEAEQGQWTEATLRAPIPLETDLTVATAPPAENQAEPPLTLLEGASLLAEARRVPPPEGADDLPPRLPVDVVADAETHYRGLEQHPFPTCFVCGPDRSPENAYRLQPGPVDERSSACRWQIGPTLAERIGGIDHRAVWAALDCPGIWSIPLERPIVLGRMTALVHSVPETGEPCQVRGRLVSSSGRKRLTQTVAYGSDGRVMGQAIAVWIELATP